MAFETLATRRNAKLRLAISGPSGSGKTYSALVMAKVFGTRIGLLDSENESASLYVGAEGIPPFFAENLKDASISTYLQMIGEAAQAGVEVLVIDSYSHSWMNVLEVVDRAGGWTRAGKTVSPQVARLVQAIQTYPGHVIATIRSKTEYAIEKDEKSGKTTMKKLGLGPVARPDTEYEFTIMLDLTREGTVSVSKSRAGSALPMDRIYDRNADLPKIAQNLKTWLGLGAPLSPIEALNGKIQFAPTLAALQALAPEIRALTPEERATLKAPYESKKATLSAAQSDAEQFEGLE